MSSLDARRTFPAARQPAPRAQSIAALDIGTSKIACLIPEKDFAGPGPLRILGVGHQPARGVRGGVIADLDACQTAVKAALDQAERMAGVGVSEVVVTLSGFAMRSERYAAEVGLSGHPIEERDVRRVIQSALSGVRADGKSILHAIPIGFSIDGAPGVRDPRGLVGSRLGVTLNVVLIPTTVKRNLDLCVHRTFRTVKASVAAPFAASLAAVVDDERDLGCICIDLGAGVTSAAVFTDGVLVHVDSVPLGGNHVTSDLAQGLGAGPSAAERLKTLYGSVIASFSEDTEMIETPQVGDDGRIEYAQAPRSVLSGIIRPRVEETLELLRDRLIAAGVDALSSRRIVLTGGGSELNGVRELAARVFGAPVRLGRPLRYSGLADSLSGPAFAGVAGALRWVANPPMDAAQKIIAGGAETGPPEGMVGRAVAWLREHFWA